MVLTDIVKLSTGSIGANEMSLDLLINQVGKVTDKHHDIICKYYGWRALSGILDLLSEGCLPCDVSAKVYKSHIKTTKKLNVLFNS